MEGPSRASVEIYDLIWALRLDKVSAVLNYLV